MNAEDARQAILDSGWDPGIIDRRLQLWTLKVAGAPMPSVASTLGVSERQAWTDWKAVNTLLGSIELPKVVALRSRMLARREHLYGLVMQQMARDSQAGQAVSTDLVRTAERLLNGMEELYALISRRPEVSINASPFVQALSAHLVGLNGHDDDGGGNGGPSRDTKGRFAPKSA